jgi:hypothetical protein
LKHLYFVCHIGRIHLLFCIYSLDIRNNPCYARGTMARRQFMRGTDPIKSTWVYPKLIL